MKRPGDACSFNGISRAELESRGAALHGVDPYFICAWCLELIVCLLEDEKDRWDATLRINTCSFCATRDYPTIAGFAVFICLGCVDRFHTTDSTPTESP